jgi:hypothetical protein
MCLLPVEPYAADHSGQEVRQGSVGWQPVVGPPNSRHGLSFSLLSVSHPVVGCRHGRSPHPERKRLAVMSSLRSPRINFLMCMLRSDSAGGDSKLITLPTQHPQEFRQHLQQAASGRSPRRCRDGRGVFFCARRRRRPGVVWMRAVQARHSTRHGLSPPRQTRLGSSIPRQIG